MKGIVFELLHEAVVEEHGERAWEQILDSAKLDGVYTTLGSYPTEDMMRLVQTASAMLGLPAADVLRWFGQRAFPRLAERYPHSLAHHRTTRDFLLTLNDIIHPEVRKLYPGAEVPVFDFDSSTAGELTVGYSSEKKLCAFAEGLMEGAAARFGERITIEHTRCMHRGDEKCVLLCRFEKNGG